MPLRPRKSSACVTLVLIGAAALSGCGDTGNRRAQYPTREACLADWGDPAECEQQAAPRTGGTSGSHFYWGPRSGSSGGSRSSSSSSSSGHSISRGGFGSHGSSSS